MSRLDTTNVLATKMGGGHMESVVGRETTGGDDKAVQVGEFGTIGALIKDNVYEFLPLAAATDKLYVIATPEVNYRDEDITDRVIKNFVLEDGAVVDAVPLVVGDKISIFPILLSSMPGKRMSSFSNSLFKYFDLLLSNSFLSSNPSFEK